MSKNDESDYLEAEEWCDALRNNHSPQEFILRLEERILTTGKAGEKKCLLDVLSRFYTEVDRPLDALFAMERRCKEFPEDPLPFIWVAEHFLYTTDEPEKSLEWLAKAEEAALRTGNFLRNTWATRARVALKMDDYTLLEKCMLEIARIRLAPNARDVQRERDFFDRADKSRLSANSIREFENYLSAGPMY